MSPPEGHGLRVHHKDVSPPEGHGSRLDIGGLTSAATQQGALLSRRFKL